MISYDKYDVLSRWDGDKKATVLQTTFSNAFTSGKFFIFNGNFKAVGFLGSGPIENMYALV